MFRLLLILSFLTFAVGHYYTGTKCSKNADCSRDLYGPGNDCGANGQCKCFKGWSGLRCLRHHKHQFHSILRTTTTGVECTDSVVTFSSMKHNPERMSECAPYVCTADVFQCPDGSYVSRDNRNFCDFFPCNITHAEKCNFNVSSPVSSASIGEAMFPSLFGSAVESTLLYPDSGTSMYNPDLPILSTETEKYTSALINNFNLFSSTDDCSWKAIQPDNYSSWDLSKCNRVSDLASCNEAAFKLGPLIDNEELPDWLWNSAPDNSTGNVDGVNNTVQSRVNRYVETIVKEYHHARYINVVENAIAIYQTASGQQNARYKYYDKLWYSEAIFRDNELPDYILQAFYTAKLNAPLAKLGYVESSVNAAGLKYDFLKKMIKDLKNRHDPIQIDYVQFKDLLGTAWEDYIKLFEHINELGSLGVKTHLSPRGVLVHAGDVSSETKLITTSFSNNHQAYIYASLAKACQLNPWCEAFEPQMTFDRRNSYTAQAPGLFDADYNEKVALNAIKATLSGSYEWINQWHNGMSIQPTDTQIAQINGGGFRPRPECSIKNICDARGCINGECVVRFWEVNPDKCSDANSTSRTSKAACWVDDGTWDTKDWFGLSSLKSRKKRRGFGKLFSAKGKLHKSPKRLKDDLHCSLDEYTGNGEHVLVEVNVSHGEYSSVGADAFDCKCLDSTSATHSIKDVTTNIVDDWGYSEREKYVLQIDLESLPDQCKTITNEKIDYQFQIERKGCVDNGNSQLKKFGVSLATTLNATTTLGVESTPDINFDVTPLPGGSVGHTQCIVVNANNLEYKYAAELTIQSLPPNMKWAYENGASNATSDFVCFTPPCLLGINDTIRIDSKDTYVEGSMARGQIFQIGIYIQNSDNGAWTLVSEETIEKNILINCITGPSTDIDTVNVQTEATASTLVLNDEGKYELCSDNCDMLTRSDTIALSVKLNQPAKESGLEIQNIHWRLTEGLPDGDVVTVEDTRHSSSLMGNSSCGKEDICDLCDFELERYSSRVDIWGNIKLETFIQELLQYEPNFYATVVSITFDIESTIGYCRAQTGRRLLSSYHLSHSVGHNTNIIRKSQTIGIRLGTEAEDTPADQPVIPINPIDNSVNPTVSNGYSGAISQNTGASSVPYTINNMHTGADMVSLTISGGTEVLVLGLGILFMLALCFLYSLCHKANRNSTRAIRNAVLTRRW